MLVTSKGVKRLIMTKNVLMKKTNKSNFNLHYLPVVGFPFSSVCPDRSIT